MATTLPSTERMDFKELELECKALSVDGQALNTTEMGYLDGITIGVQAASKCVVPDANVNSGISKVTELHVGATGSELQQDFVVEVRTTAPTITAAESGRVYALNAAAGLAITLPAVAAGLRYKFVVKTVPTSGTYAIGTESGDNVFHGSLTGAGLVIPVVAQDSIVFDQDDSDIGDMFDIWCDGTNWYVSGFYTTTGGMSISQT